MKKARQIISFGLTAGLLLIAGCGGQPAAKTTDNKPPAETMPKVLSMGTHGVGSLVNTIGTGIAAVLSKSAGSEVKAIAMTGPQEWMPMMTTKEIDLGVVNAWDSGMGWSGKSTYGSISQNKGFPVSLIASGSKSLVSLVVAGNSGIKNGSDLKGKRYAGIVTGSAGITAEADAFLANYGLTRSDVQEITVPSVDAGVQAIIEGRADAAVAALGMAKVQELHAAKGARVMSLDPSPEALKRTNEYYPGSIVKIGPSSNYAGVKEDTNVLVFEMYLLGRNNLSEGVVYNLVKSLWDNDKELVAINANLKTWTTDNFAIPNFTLPYHPGAIKFYKEKGVWTPSMEELQQKLLASKKS